MQRFTTRETALRLTGLIGTILATLLLYSTFRYAKADWLSAHRTRPTILAAIHMFPDNSLFYRFWAEIEPKDELLALRQAAQVNPLNPSIRIDLGVAAEKAGNLTEAEANFLTAVQLERTFAPRNILADFYFRHKEPEKFWPAVKDALEHTTGDTTGLFNDCWNLNPKITADSILERAIPKRQPVLRNYLEYLVARDRLEAAEPVADWIMANDKSIENAPALQNYCDRLIVANNSSRAVTIWNWLCIRKFLPYEILEPEKGRVLTNGKFTIASSSRGFDWRLFPTQGLYIEAGKQKGLDLTFTGKQPEQCEILTQVIPLEANRTYRLRVEYSTSDIDRESGLTWRVAIPNGPEILVGSLLGGENQFTGTFVAPPDVSLGRLLLKYERVKGTVRIEGSIEIRSVELSYSEP